MGSLTGRRGRPATPAHSPTRLYTESPAVRGGRRVVAATLEARAGQLVTDAELAVAVWGPWGRQYVTTAHGKTALKVSVCHLREVGRRVGVAARIERVRGRGYRLVLPQ